MIRSSKSQDIFFYRSYIERFQLKQNQGTNVNVMTLIVNVMTLIIKVMTLIIIYLIFFLVFLLYFSMFGKYKMSLFFKTIIQ
jgi:hypothetical protein